MAASQSVLEILIQAVDESGAALEGVQNNLKKTSQDALAAGTEVSVLAASIDAAYGGIVDAAVKNQESFASLKASVDDIVKSANDAGQSQSSYATQVAFLTDKINAQKATIAQANATLDKNTGSATSTAAAHEKAAATIATATDNINKLQQQLDLLRSQEGLVGASTDDIIAKFEDAADAAVNFGFENDEAESSLKNLFAATKSAPDALSALRTAMDLARAKNEDLATATQQVIMAMQGQGRALIGVGINIKDGLSGMQALAAIQGVVGGQAEAYANTLGGQMAIALANINKLLEDMGKTQLPMLTNLFQAINKIITAVDSWTNKHQELTRIILIAVAALGALLTIVGTLLIVVGTLGFAIALLGAPFLIIIALVVALATIIAANWDLISTKTQQVWNAIKTFFTATWDGIKNLFHSALTDVQNIWNTVWTNMSTFLSNIWNTIKSVVKTGVNDVISAINAFINALDAIHITLPSITIPGTKLSTPAVNLGFSIPNIPMLAAGGFVTQPTLALIGEAGPEAVMPLSALGTGVPGGSTQIIVNINGGIFPADQSAIKQIGDMLAKQINLSLRTRNYAT